MIEDVGVVRSEPKASEAEAPEPKVTEAAEPEAKTAKPRTAKRTGRTRRKFRRVVGKKKASSSSGASPKYPRHPVERALRIPRAIIDQNAGKECTDAESARYVGVGLNGDYKVEISSSLKYGFWSELSLVISR